MEITKILQQDIALTRAQILLTKLKNDINDLCQHDADAGMDMMLVLDAADNIQSIFDDAGITGIYVDFTSLSLSAKEDLKQWSYPIADDDDLPF